MNAEKDSILKREFRRVMDKSLPQPSWDEVEARAGGLALRWQGRRKLIPALAVLLVAITIPALAYAAHEVFFDSSPEPFQGAIDAFSRVGGAPGKPADERSVVVGPRRVVTLPLLNDKTAALWVAPTIDGNYCFDTQVVEGDPDSPGKGLAWGQGYNGFPGCGKHDRALDIGYDVSIPRDGTPFILMSGGSGIKDADTLEIVYEDGASSSEPTYATSPIDAVLFLFEIPSDHTEPGTRPAEIVLRAEDGTVLARDREFLASFWSEYDEAASNAVHSLPPSEPQTPGSETPGSEETDCYDPTVPGSPVPESGLTCGESGGLFGLSVRPNSPGYQERQFEYPGNAHP